MMANSITVKKDESTCYVCVSSITVIMQLTYALAASGISIYLGNDSYLNPIVGESAFIGNHSNSSCALSNIS